MPDACNVIRKRAGLAALDRLRDYERLGGSDEYDRAHVQAVEIIAGRRAREPRSDDDARAREEVAAWAKRSAATIVGRGREEQFQEIFEAHLAHAGCRAVILAVRDLDDVGRPVIRQQRRAREREQRKAYLRGSANPN